VTSNFKKALTIYFPNFYRMTLLELFKKLSKLKDTPRIGWPLAGVGKTETEDVAQHSFDVISISLLLAEELKKRESQLNLEKILLMACIHDWSEALTGDLPYPAAEYLRNKEAKEKMEFRAAQDVFADSKNLLQIWEEFTKGQSLEAKVVKAADYLSILVQAIQYMERGYFSADIQKLWENVKQDLDPLTDEFPELKEILIQLEREKQKFKLLS